MFWEIIGGGTGCAGYTLLIHPKHLMSKHFSSREKVILHFYDMYLYEWAKLKI